jgi:two-component system, OmpR family, alkaline phosphatase synthesis response regulator PhoP
MTVRILIADDEPSIVMAVRDELAFEGFEVHSASDGPGALEKAREIRPDVLLLDLMLPGMNGFEICRRLRPERPDIWIIMLTVRNQEADRVTGFEVGADDYVTKPFSLRELAGRIRVGLRRVGGNQQGRNFAFGDVEIDLRSRRVLKGGVEVPLTRKEFEILVLLLKRAGEVITRDEFLNILWGEDVHVTHRTVDTHVATLRKKLEADPNAPVYFVGVRGVGYRFNEGLLKT